MIGQQTIKEIKKEELLQETQQLKNDGYRLVAITCGGKDELQITYSFDKDLDFVNLRLIIGQDSQIESISHIYSFAFLYENEIKELFGVEINNISLDFQNNLYKIAVKTPFKVEKEDK